MDIEQLVKYIESVWLDDRSSFDQKRNKTTYAIRLRLDELIHNKPTLMSREKAFERAKEIVYDECNNGQDIPSLIDNFTELLTKLPCGLNPTRPIEVEICDQLSYLPTVQSVNGVALICFDSVVELVQKAFQDAGARADGGCKSDGGSNKSTQP